MATPDEDEPLVPVSALQHAVFCMRQAALIHTEQQWVENRYTAEGSVLHAASDRGDARSRGDVRRVHGLPVGSVRLGLSGVCDLVEVRGWRRDSRDAAEVSYFPVEYKRGRPKKHRADEVQLCAQALCLEEMTGGSIVEGALFYALTKRRVTVAFDAELRELTERIAAQLRAVFASGRTPPPTSERNRCKSCSLLDVCLPDVARRGVVGDWLVRELSSLNAAPEDE